MPYSRPSFISISPRRACRQKRKQSISKKGIFGIVGKGPFASCKLTHIPRQFPRSIIGENSIIIGIPCVIKKELSQKSNEWLLKKFPPSNLNNEIEILKKLDHPNIIRLIPSDEPGKFTMEDGGIQLLNWFHNFDFLKQLAIFAQIVCAIKYLHDKEIFRGDLHLGNILLQKNGRVSIVDFGVATFEEINKDRKDKSQRNDLATACYYFDNIMDRWNNYLEPELVKSELEASRQKLYPPLLKLQSTIEDENIAGAESVISELIEILRSMPGLFPKWEGLKPFFGAK